MHRFRIGFAKTCTTVIRVLPLAWATMAGAAPWSWKPVPTPQPAAMSSTVRMGNELYVGWGNGIMRSLDSGKTWIKQSEVSAPDLGVADSTLFIFPESGLLRSVDRGKTFAQVGAAFGTKHVRQIKVLAKVWLALAGGPTDMMLQSWFSADKGLTWTPAYRISATGARGVVALDTTLFIGESDSGVFRSRDRGLTWELLRGGGLPPGESFLFRIRDGKLYDVAEGNGLFVSADGGNSWKAVKLALNPPKGVIPEVVEVVAQAEMLFVNIISGTGFGGVFGSFDAGKTWQPLRNGLPLMHDSADVTLNTVNSLTMLGTRLIVDIAGGNSGGPLPYRLGMYQSLDFGSHWTPVSINMPAELNASPAPYLDIYKGIMLLDDFGNSQTPQSCLSVDYGTVWKCSPVFIHGGTAGLFVQGNDVYARYFTGFYYSPDFGGHWSLRDMPEVSGMSAQGNDLFVMLGATVSHSPDKGVTWDNRISLRMSIGSTLFVNDFGSLSASEDGGITWRSLGNGLPRMQTTGTSTFTVLGKSLFAATPKGLFQSEDKGATWTTIATGLPSAEVTGLAAMGGHVLVQTASGAFRGEVGAEKSPAVSGWKAAAWSPNFLGFAAQDSVLFGVTGPADWGVLASYDSGSTWKHASGRNPMPFARAITSAGGRLTVTKGDLYFHSKDQGADWDTTKAVGAPPGVRGLAQIGRQLLAVNPMGIWTSPDDGLHWAFLNGTDTFGFTSITCIGPVLYGAGHTGLSVSSDTGKSWTMLSLAPAKPIVVGAFGQKLWVAEAGGNVWVGSNPDFPTVITPAESGSVSVNAFALTGSGSSAGFRIQVGENALLTLSMTDARGRAVGNRRDIPMAKGSHRYSWDGAPGFRPCFYRITVRSENAPGKVLFHQSGKIP